MANYYYSGQGSIYVAERNTDGTPKGFIAVGNVPTLELSIETTKFEHKESESGSRAVDLTIVQEKKGTFSMTMESLNLENLALGFWGETANTAAATGESETIYAYLDKRTILKHQNLDSGTALTIKDATDTTTYEYGNGPTDANSKNGYIDYVNGAIYTYTDAMQTTKGAAANVSDAEELHVTTMDTQGYDSMFAFTKESMERYIRFEGLNTVYDGASVVVDIFKGQLDPLQNYGLINEELGSIEITGSILYDDLQTGTSKFFRQVNF